MYTLNGFVCTRFGGLTAERCRQYLCAWRAVKTIKPGKKSKANSLTFANFSAKITAFANSQCLQHLPEKPCPERLTLWYYQFCNNMEETRVHPHAQWVGATQSRGQHPARCAALFRLCQKDGGYNIKDICLVHFNYTLYKAANPDYGSDSDAPPPASPAPDNAANGESPAEARARRMAARIDAVSTDEDWEIINDCYYNIKSDARVEHESIGQIPPMDSDAPSPDFVPLQSSAAAKRAYKKGKLHKRILAKHWKLEKEKAYLNSKSAWRGMKDNHIGVDWAQVRNSRDVTVARETAKDRGIDEGADVEVEEDEEESAGQSRHDHALTGVVEYTGDMDSYTNTTAVSRDNTLDTQAEESSDHTIESSDDESNAAIITRDNTVNEDEKVEDELLQEEKDETTPAHFVN